MEIEVTTKRQGPTSVWFSCFPSVRFSISVPSSILGSGRRVWGWIGQAFWRDIMDSMEIEVAAAVHPAVRPAVGFHV